MNNFLENKYNFYLKNGYVIIPSPKNKKFKNIICKINNYYSKVLKRLNYNESPKLAFRDKNGNPRHIINLFRDKESLVNSLIKEEYFRKILFKFCRSSHRFYFTHAKLSFKTKNKDASWSPHQDNGYKKFNRKDGFAIFICLEEMNEENGALQVFPKSHLLGTLPHKRLKQSITGDGQYIIPKKEIPQNIKPISIKANKGDLIIFCQDCIHQSGQTKTSSRRLALIFEIEKYTSFSTDDYGRMPVMAIGKLNLIEKIITFLYSLISPLKIWIFLSRFPILKRIFRKYILSPLGLQKISSSKKSKYF